VGNRWMFPEEATAQERRGGLGLNPNSAPLYTPRLRPPDWVRLECRASWAVVGHGPAMWCLAGLGCNVVGWSSNGPPP
jgi:hypothetical protein